MFIIPFGIKTILLFCPLCAVISVYDCKNLGSDDEKQAVDLGLSVRWASCHIGASAPEGTGGYYDLGETEEKSEYEGTYKYCVGGNYTNLGSTICGTQYDVAPVKWGDKWRVPTSALIAPVPLITVKL